ncbi:hypothetical protein [uncultured Cohaesibacter sp.]|uniref:hypothetical protein n=1 Tax=uncultured Cohaesibacter sp. TaxID=1002546 RepID=UPI00292E2311|nr:hypothetical protein [uncultured Cohaesibacter sp.]
MLERIPPTPGQEWELSKAFKNTALVCNDSHANIDCFGLTCLEGGLRTVIAATGGTAPNKFYRGVTVDDQPKQCVRFVGYYSDKISYFAKGGDRLSKDFVDMLLAGSTAWISSDSKAFGYSLKGSSAAIKALARKCGINLTQLPTKSYTTCSHRREEENL